MKSLRNWQTLHYRVMPQKSIFGEVFSEPIIGRPKDAERFDDCSASFSELLGIFFAINRVNLRYHHKATSSASEILRLREREQRRKHY